MTAASLANYSIHVCLRVDVRLCLCMCVFSINKGRSEQKVSSKAPKHHKCVCVHRVLNLMTGETSISISLHHMYVCVFVHVE